MRHSRQPVAAWPAIFTYGFRPFFLFGAFYAGAALLLWQAMFEGQLTLDTGFSSLDWHVHEMLFGYVAAIVAGFLLTAIPNWTGRLPLNGLPLLVLVLVWVAGRVAVAFSGVIGWWLAALIDVSFLFMVLAAATTEIIAGKNWRNLRVVAIVAVYAVANAWFHIEAHTQGASSYSQRLGLSAVILLVILIGGRIVPSFTRNWLARQSPGRLPAPFGRFDALAFTVSALALAVWTAVPDNVVTGVLLLAAGLLEALRLARWAGERTLGDPLVLVLHVGYAFIFIGFILVGASILGLDVPISAGSHVWTIGAIGAMTLAVMTRASRGHTGRTLEAPPSTQVLYLALITAAVLRALAAGLPEFSLPLLWASTVAWIVAFWGFCVVYGPALLRPRVRPA